MKVRTRPFRDEPSTSELCAILRFQGKEPSLGRALQPLLRRAHATGDLSPELRAVRVFHGGRGEPKRLVSVGMGARDDVDAERLRRAAALVQARAELLGARGFELVVDARDHRGLDPFAAGAALAEGVVLGAYRYEPPRRQKPKARKGQRGELVYRGSGQRAFADGVAFGLAAGLATCRARDLENMPGNLATPTYLAREARKLHGGGVKVRVLDRRELTRLGMGALLGVARGSAEQPKLIVLDHQPRGAKETVCVVGKGLTFDSGGISIKPSAKMDEMRYDMCGGGAVLGLFHALHAGALRGGRTRVIGVIAAAENMPSGDAQKPGDVVTAYDGTTIEVLNTDAEGRLVLADALAWAVDQYQPDCVVDLATLTGAAIVALGHEAAAVIANDDALAEELIEAGWAADEPLWELPLWDEHRQQMKSRFADLQNINGGQHGGGTIAGAAFLSYFVGDTPWAHLDIAGTAWGQRVRDYYRGGASGTGVRTLLHWLRVRG